jgi:hypothetical protein
LFFEKFVTKLATVKKVDFSGAENASDYFFYVILKTIRKNKEKIVSVTHANFSGCKYISIMSISYLYSSFDKALDRSDDTMKVRVALNEKISEDILVSLHQFENKPLDRQGID